MKYLFSLVLIFALSLAAQNITATKAYVDKKDATKRDKLDMSVYRDDAFGGILSWRVSATNKLDGSVITTNTSFRFGRLISGGITGIRRYWTDILTYGNDAAVEITTLDHESYMARFSFAGESFSYSFGLTNSVSASDNYVYSCVPVYDRIATESGVQSVITNVARDVVNSLWDAEMSVTWQAKMVDGNLYYIAVTNVNLEAAR